MAHWTRLGMRPSDGDRIMLRSLGQSSLRIPAEGVGEATAEFPRARLRLGLSLWQYFFIYSLEDQCWYQKPGTHLKQYLFHGKITV